MGALLHGRGRWIHCRRTLRAGRASTPPRAPADTPGTSGTFSLGRHHATKLAEEAHDEGKKGMGARGRSAHVVLVARVVVHRVECQMALSPLG
jgi:hypothetical protein